MHDFTLQLQVGEQPMSKEEYLQDTERLQPGTAITTCPCTSLCVPVGSGTAVMVAMQRTGIQ